MSQIPIIGGAKPPANASFDDINQAVAQAVQRVLPQGFNFVLLMVAPGNETRMLYNVERGHADAIVQHFAGKQPARRTKLVTLGGGS